jgi:hypothetical protein
MSEIPEVDPMAFTDEQPQADPTEAPKDEFFGDGIMSDNSPSDSSEGTGQPTEDSSPETAEIETEPTAPETKEEKAGQLRYKDYTRKSQERETQYQQRMDALDQREQEFLQKQQALLDQQTQQPQREGQSLVSQLQAAANNPNLTPEDRAGLSVIAELVNTVQAQNSQLQELVQFQQTVEPQFQQHEFVIQGLNAKQQSEVVETVRAQRDEAASKLGEDVMASASGLVTQAFFRGGQLDAKNWAPPLKPGSNTPFTIAEYVAAISGRNLEAQQTAARKNGAVRGKAQLLASNIGADTATSDRAAISREEAIRNW